MNAELAIIALSMPILFALHNFEEVIVYDYFLHKNKQRILDHLPKKAAICLAGVLKRTSAASFALAVTILSGVLTAISYFALWQNNQLAWLLWLAATIVFAFQLVVHIFTAVYWRGYAFGTISAVLFAPVFGWMIWRSLHLMHFNLLEVVGTSLIVGVISYGGGIPLLFGVVMKKFEMRFGLSRITTEAMK